MRRDYTALDLLRFAKFLEDKNIKRNQDAVKAYDKVFQKLTDEQVERNIKKALESWDKAESETKLQEGDYVNNLTKEQWDELLEIEDFPYPVLEYYKNDCRMVFRGYVLGNIECDGIELKTELSFDDFRQRAINTFK